MAVADTATPAIPVHYRYICICMCLCITLQRCGSYRYTEWDTPQLEALRKRSKCHFWFAKYLYAPHGGIVNLLGNCPGEGRPTARWDKKQNRRCSKTREKQKQSPPSITISQLSAGMLLMTGSPSLYRHKEVWGNHLKLYSNQWLTILFHFFQDPAGIFELIEVVGNGTYGQVYKVS